MKPTWIIILILISRYSFSRIFYQNLKFLKPKNLLTDLKYQNDFVSEFILIVVGIEVKKIFSVEELMTGSDLS